MTGAAPKVTAGESSSCPVAAENSNDDVSIVFSLREYIVNGKIMSEMFPYEVTEVIAELIERFSYEVLQWNLSITTTSKIKFITCDLFSNVF